ncbi:MAG TPA: hypothetical protein VL970_12080 [Candidatus Acidoferrales bacterium]|nr:hypothetical protein [Candidatus Acidoferrales bacterium]
MKTNPYFYSFVAGGLIFFSGLGCHKQGSSAQPKTLDEAVAAVRATLGKGSPQVQSNFFKGVSFGLRYGNYASAEANLQQIAADPSLTPEQKQAIGELDVLLKQKLQSQPNAPAQ